MYVFLSIMFGSAFVYYYSANKVRTEGFRAPTKEELLKWDELEDEDQGMVFEYDKVSMYINLMILSFYPAFLVIKATDLVKRLIGGTKETL